MAAKWGTHEASFRKLESAIKEYSAKECGAQIGAFAKHYKACQDLAEKLSFALVKARSNGVTGGDLKDFRKDSGFNDAYKALDREVDALWKEQEKAFQMTTMAKQTVSDLKILGEHVETDIKAHSKELKEAQEELKKSQDKAKSGKGTVSPSAVKLVQGLEKDFNTQSGVLGKLMDRIQAASKDLTEAGGLYRREVDQTMENYAAKFQKTIEKILDLAPKSAANEAGLPTALQERVLGVAVKKAVALGQEIEKQCRTALEKAAKDRALAAPEMKAAGAGLALLKKSHTALAANRKKYAKAIKDAKDSKELYKQFRFADEAFAGAEKALVETAKALAGMK